ncbi:MAG TPA: hypothetical protein P5167_02290 [Bacteroidales bacterium]|nr:hypothetical protein [Bacteroidales bacterium]
MLTDDDILLIQRKVDGTLTEHEETVFHALTASNPRAAELYKELLCVQQKLRDDAAGIPTVDVTGDVMAAVERKTKVRNVFLYGWKSLYAYAALFILVFTLGVLAANYLIPPLGTWQQEDIAGTMTRKHTSAYKDHEEGIEIDMEAFRKEGLFVNALFVKSRDSLKVEFIPGQNHSENFFFRRIWPGNNSEPHVERAHYVYGICGEYAIFTITNPPVDSEILFTKNGTRMHKIVF